MRRRCSFSRTTLTAAIRMTSRNHLSSTRSRILMTLSLHPMKHRTSLQKRLLRPATSSHNTYSRQTIIIHVSCAPRRQPDHRSLRCMTHNCRVSTRRPRKLSTVTRLKLNVTNQRSLRNLTQRQDIANLNRRFSAKTKLLPHKHTLCSHRVTRHAVLETNKNQRRTTTRIMRKPFNDTINRGIKKLLRRNRRWILGSRNPLMR